MKITQIVVGIILVTSAFYAKGTLKNDIIGQAYNSQSQPVVAISYAMGHNRYTIPEGLNFVKPETVSKLADIVLPPPPGPKESIEEIPSASEFYDGSLKLNVIDVKCKLYTNPTDCVHQSHCGWCKSSGSCISGNNVGPFEQCVKGSFIFSPSVPNWQPQLKVVNENVGGISMTVIPK